ncbi:ABC transporter ATP-binding protein [Nannocystis bainbridge]|uniref:ABC transporter ATP-binding protein n=1 Tax=Nannocystis bainbridge TaxID=2995303 RepID=A0ABT5E3I0_9BACT|nr:ABC transporter ATP-binding protein [Nannocystis bainbridge]MDC0720381.1 ABC transporter ATP-binding protein [Nannocystis bainbridge]
MTLSLRALTKSYAGRLALAEVDAELPAGGYTCLMGASGSGKTTLLRIVAGLERQDRGSVLLDGRPLDDLPAERRPVHTLFQDYALFPHLDAADNVAFAPRLLGLRGRELTARVRALLADVGLDMSFETRKPAAMSGGEQQRLALARALAGEPRWLLLDEPLAALDRPLRAGLRRLLRDVTRRRGLGCLHVTHDPEEALALADRLLVFGGGRLLAAGAPAALYAAPPSLPVARLLGEITPEPGGDGWLRPEHLRLAVGGASKDMSPSTCPEDHALNDMPHGPADLPRGSGASDRPAARALGTVRAVACLGDRWEVEVDIGGRVHLSRVPGDPRCGPGEPACVTWDRARVLRFAGHEP